MSSNFNCLQTKLTHSRKLVGAIGLRPPVGSLVAKCEEKRSMNYDIANIMPANHSENETRCLCQDQRAKIYFDKLDASNNRAERRLGTDRWNPSLDRIGTPVLSFFARLASSGAAVVRCFALLFAFLLLPILSAEAQRATEINLDVQKIIVQGSDTTVGGTVTYQIIVHNSNFDGDVLDATNVVLKDSLPAGIKFDSVTGGTWDDRTGEWHISTLTAGEAKTLIIETTIEAGTEGQTICNTALVKSADQTDKDSTYGETKLGEDDEAEVCFTVSSDGGGSKGTDLEVSKTIDPSSGTAVGDTIIYTVTLTNNSATGSLDATNVVVYDLLPQGLGFLSSNQNDYQSGSGEWSLGGLALGNSIQLVIGAIIQAGTEGQTICNTAYVKASAQDDVDSIAGEILRGEDDESTYCFTVDAGADPINLSVTKSVSDARPAAGAGATVKYTITVTNSGAGAASGVVVNDLLPAGTSYNAASASQGSYSSGSGNWNVGGLAGSGGSATLEITANITGNQGDKPLNCAMVTATNQHGTAQADPNSDPGAISNPREDDEACTEIEIIGTIDLELAKSVIGDLTEASLGDQITYSITVANVDVVDATGVTVEDLLPNGVSFSSVESVTQGSYNSNDGVWTVGNIPSGTVARLRIVVQVTALSGVVTNCAQVLSTDQKNLETHDWDSVPGDMVGNNAVDDDEDCASFTAKSGGGGSPTKIDLEVDKSVNTVRGTNMDDLVTYTITVTNSDRAEAVIDASNIVVEDLLPAGVEFVSSSNGNYDPVTGEWVIEKLAAGASITLTIVVKIDGLGEGRIVCNTVFVKSADQEDRDSKVGETKTGEDDEAEVCFTIDSMGEGGMGSMSCPAGSTFQGNLFSGLNQVLAPSGGTVTDAYGQNWTIAITGDINELPPTNNACDTDPPEFENGLFETCYHWSNNTNGVNFTFTPAGGNIDSLVVLVMDVDGSIDGDNSSHIDHVVFPAATSVSPVNANPSFTYTANSLTGILGESSSDSPTDRGAGEVFFPSGLSSFSYSYSSIPPATPNLQHILTQIGACVTGDPYPNGVVDLELTKSIAPGSGTVNGSTVTYVLELTNNDSAPNTNFVTATNITVTDFFPTAFLGTPTASSGQYNTSTNIWTIPSLAPGASISVTIEAEITAENLGANICNYAEVTTQTEDDLDSAPNNGTYPTPNEDDEFVVCFNLSGPPVNRIDLELNKDIVAGSGTGNGDQVTYTLEIENNSATANLTATGVSVLDYWPAGLGTPTASNGSYNTSTHIWTVPTLAPGQSYGVQLIATITGTSGDSICNQAEVETQDQLDYDSVHSNGMGANEDDDDFVCFTVSGPPANRIDLELDKSIVTTGGGSTGNSVTYQLVLTNNSANATVPATGINVKDYFPAGLNYVSATGPGSYNVGAHTWILTSLGVGQTATLELIGEITGTAGDVICNGTEVSAHNEVDIDSEPNNGLVENEDDDDEVCFTVTNSTNIDLEITKTVSDPQPAAGAGATVKYTVTVVNNGNATATGVTVNDLLPAGTSYNTHTATQGSYNSASGDWSVGTLAPNASETLVITANIIGSQGDKPLNCAMVTATDQHGTSQADPDSDPGPINSPLEDDEACVEIEIIGTLDLEINKTIVGNVNNPSDGDYITYEITLANVDVVDATGVEVSDQLPAGVNFDSVVTATHGSFNSSNGIWNVGTMPSGGPAAVLRLKVQVDAAAGQVVRNCVEVWSTNEHTNNSPTADWDSDPGNMDPNNPDEDDESCVSFTVAGVVVVADCGPHPNAPENKPCVYKSVTPSTVSSGDLPENVTFTLEFHNDTMITDEEFRIYDILDPSLTYQPGSLNVVSGGCSYNSVPGTVGNITYPWSGNIPGSGTPDGVSNVLYFEFDLPVDEICTVEYQVEIAAGTTSTEVCNNAWMLYLNSSTWWEDHEACVEIVTPPVADCTGVPNAQTDKACVLKSVTPTSVNQADLPEIVTFELELRNDSGSSSLEWFDIWDALPAGMSYTGTGVTVTSGNCTVNQSSISYPVSGDPPGPWGFSNNHLFFEVQIPIEEVCTVSYEVEIAAGTSTSPLCNEVTMTYLDNSPSWWHWDDACVTIVDPGDISIDKYAVTQSVDRDTTGRYMITLTSTYSTDETVTVLDLIPTGFIYTGTIGGQGPNPDCIVGNPPSTGGTGPITLNFNDVIVPANSSCHTTRLFLIYR